MPQHKKDQARQLVLLRHAKSSWEASGLNDHERPLNARGERASRLLETHFASRDRPDLILCSSALRTRQTFDQIKSAFPKAPRVSIEDSLYLASSAGLLKRIEEVPDEVGFLLLIGHNPGIHELAETLAAHSPRKQRTRIAAKFPTGAAASYRFTGPWRGIAHAPIVLTDFVTPADLSAGSED